MFTAPSQPFLPEIILIKLNCVFPRITTLNRKNFLAIHASLRHGPENFTTTSNVPIIFSFKPILSGIAWRISPPLFSMGYNPLICIPPTTASLFFLHKRLLQTTFSLLSEPMPITTVSSVFRLLLPKRSLKSPKSCRNSFSPVIPSYGYPDTTLQNHSSHLKRRSVIHGKRQ